MGAVTKLVFSWDISPRVGTSIPPKRRETEAELARMKPEDRILYLIEHPLSAAEREARFEREMKGLDELSWADQQEPPEEGESHFR